MLNVKLRYNDLNANVFSCKYNDIYFKTAGKYNIFTPLQVKRLASLFNI